MFGKSSDITYQNMIPAEFRRMKPTDVVITTFTLDGTVLDKVLGDLLMGGALERADENKDNIRVYCDHGQFIKDGKFGSVIRKVGPQKNLRFHPKVILIRYEEGDDKNQVKYFLSVSSSNISASSSVEAYFATSGEVGETEGNGKGVAEFLKNNIPRSDANKRMIDELEKTTFQAEGCSAIEFLSADEVNKKLFDNDGLLIVSPYLNIGALKDNAEKIAGIYSKKDSFAGITEEIAQYFYTKLYVNCDKTVHAKVYCYKKGGKTHWIIGSSNATLNGFYRKKDEEKEYCGNTEFNVYFTTKEDDYEKFQNILWHEHTSTQKNNNNEDICLFKKYEPVNTENDETDAHKKLDNLIYSVINNLSFSDGYIEKANYRVKIHLDDKFWEKYDKKDNEIHVAVSVQEDEKKQEFKKEESSITLTSQKTFYYVFVSFRFNSIEQTRLIPINWKNEQIIKERAESERKEAEIYAREREKEHFRGGSQYRSRSETTREAGQKTSAQTSREERFEKLMIYCRNKNIDKNALKELLETLALETPDTTDAKKFYLALSEACDTYKNGDVKDGK